MRELFLSLLLLISTHAAMATVRMSPEPAKVVQADGTVLTIIGRGDEHDHYFTTTDGVLLFHRGNDFFIARIDAMGNLLPTTQLAHEKSLRKAQEQQLVSQQKRHLFYNRLRKNPRHVPTVNEYNGDYPALPSTGSPRILVILAEFADVKFIDSDPIPVFDQYFNYDTIDRELGNGTARRNFGSVGKYYRDMSFGQFNPQFEVMAKVTLDENLHYYGQDGNERVDTLFRNRFIPDVCQKAYEQGVDFSNYDNDGDGIVDLVYIIYAGYAQSWTGNSTDCIWPKTGTYECGPFNGKTVNLYSANSELNAYPGAFNNEVRINGVGLACHEFGHCLGLPDIYASTNEARHACNHSMEYWDIMDLGEYVQNGYYPSEFNPWEREVLGWMTMETLETSGNYVLPRLSADSRKAYRIVNDNDPTGNEYLILQNIQDTLWNRRQQGHGMLVMHVDFQPEVFAIYSNAVNNEVGHSRFTFIPADGEYISQHAVDEVNITSDMFRASHWGDPFPGDADVHEILGFDMYTGRLNKQLLNITETADGDIEFYYLSPPVPTAILQAETTEEDERGIYSANGILHNRNGQLPKGIYCIPQRGTYRKVLIR